MEGLLALMQEWEKHSKRGYITLLGRRMSKEGKIDGEREREQDFNS